MKNLSELELSVAQLPDVDFAKFREWFWEYENEKWDEQIEKDIAAKNLKAIKDKALYDFNNGKYKSL